MSLILEALRKSEAERRRGLPPDLRSELPPPAPPGRRGLPAWGWAALAVAVAVLATWSWSRLPSDTGKVGRPPSAGTAAETDRPSPASADDNSAASPEPPLPARTPARPVPPAEEAAATAPPASKTPPASPAAAPTPAAAAPPIGVAQPSRQQEPVPAAPAAAPPTTEPRDTADTPRPPPSGDDRVLDVAELDAGTRQALPPLKLSMHLWNEDPARRFVILDGRRLGEGDRIGEASIVRIERDGVLLQWQGRGIRVPVR